MYGATTEEKEHRQSSSDESDDDKIKLTKLKDGEKKESDSESDQSLDDYLKENKDEIKAKARDYGEGFSVIGLSKILYGHPIEKVFWLICLIVGISIAVWLLHTLIVKYTGHETYIDSSTIITSTNIFPTITFCKKRMRKSTYCGFGIAGSIQLSSLIWQPCERDNSSKMGTWSMSASSGSISWKNANYRVTCLSRNLCVNADISQEYLTSTPGMGDDCFTWNYKGDYYNMRGEIELEIGISSRFFNKDKDVLEAIIHESKDYPLSQDNAVRLTPTLDYVLNFQKTVNIRMEAPFHTDCQKSDKRNIFPGKYSVTNCVDSLQCLDVLKQCGDTYDFCWKFIPKDIYEKYHRNKTIFDIYQCLREANISDYSASCRTPCNETEFHVTSSSYLLKKSSWSTKFTLTLKYQSPYVYEKVEEKELYHWEELFSEIGGTIGLMCGFSILSIAEIFVYLLLRCSSKFAK